MRTHAIATLALTELYGLTGRARRRDVATPALGALLRAGGDRGWPRHRHDGGTPDLGATTWAALALKSAQMCEIELPEGTSLRIVEALGGFGAPADHPPRECAALGIAWQFHTGADPSRDALLKTAVATVSASPPAWDPDAPRPLDPEGVYLGTLLEFQAGSAHWKAWADAIVVALRETVCRDQDTCRLGSWDACGPVSRDTGRVRRTAFAVLTLSSFYHYHTVFRGTPR